MKKKLLFSFLAFVSFSLQLAAQKELKQIMSLKIAGKEGTNAGSVVWHPVHKKYYTSIIGNPNYFMSVFDEKGKAVQEEIPSSIDLRGMWYNPHSKNIEFNGYATNGFGKIKLKANGLIDKLEVDKYNYELIDDNSVGLYYPAEKLVILPLDEFTLLFYEKVDELEVDYMELQLGCKTVAEMEQLEEDEFFKRVYERNSRVAFTGIEGKEIAVLNVAENSIELYDIETGLMVTTLLLPKKLDLELPHSFNFSYANNTYWIFDTEKRTWIGFK